MGKKHVSFSKGKILVQQPFKTEYIFRLPLSKFTHPQKTVINSFVQHVRVPG